MDSALGTVIANVSFDTLLHVIDSFDNTATRYADIKEDITNSSQGQRNSWINSYRIWSEYMKQALLGILKKLLIQVKISICKYYKISNC